MAATAATQATPPARHQRFKTVRETVAGIMGGSTLVVVGHPLDTIKVRLQTGGNRFNGMYDCFRSTVRTEGVLGLYKGMLAPLIGMSAVKSVLFSSYARARSAFATPSALSPLQTAQCGMFAGFCAAFIESPMELLKSQRQVQYGSGGSGGSGGGAAQSSTAAVGRAIASRFGVRGLYQGLGATFLRNVPGFGIFFVTYEGVKHAIQGDQPLPSPVAVLAAGLSAGVAYWTLCYPADVVKSNLQADNIDPAHRRFRGIADCVRQLNAAAAQPGASLAAVYYRGLLPCALRAAVGNAALFAAVEMARVAFDRIVGE